MTENTIDQSIQNKRLPSPDEMEYVRDLMGYTPNRFSMSTVPYTFYVRTTGDDSNNGLSEADAFLTIQGAIHKIPFSPSKEIVIDVGAGTFAGFSLGCNISNGADSNLSVFQCIKFKGTMGLATLTTGVNSGTASGGSVDALQRCVLNKPAGAANWTVNELVGKRIKKISGHGPYYPTHIIANDATTLTTGSVYQGVTSQYDNTTVFEIEDYETVIDINPSGTWHCINIQKTLGYVQLKDLAFVPSSGSFVTVISILRSDTVDCHSCKIKGDGASLIGFAVSTYQASNITFVTNTLVQDCAHASGRVFYAYSNIEISYSAVINITAGSDVADIKNVGGASSIYSCYFDGAGNAEYGLRLYQGDCSAYNLVFNNFKNAAIASLGDAVHLLVYNITVKTCKYGINFANVGVGAGSTLNCDTSSISFDISDCTADGISIKQGKASLQGIVGTGNAGYGLRLGIGAAVDIASDVTVTGAGDAIVGATVATYAGDLPNPGDVVSETAKGIVLGRV